MEIPTVTQVQGYQLSLGTQWQAVKYTLSRAVFCAKTDPEIAVASLYMGTYMRTDRYLI